MTSTQTQLRRGTSTQVDAMTPVVGEVVVDTTNNRLCLGDGSTAGGHKFPNAHDVQNQSFTYSTVGGTANAITLTNLPVVGAYVNGLKLSFKATATNTGATTVNVDGLGTKNLYKLSGTSLVALSGNEVISGAIYDITYDGTQFQLTNSAGGGGLVVRRQVFTSSGTYTPNANMLYCDAIVVGGGGGGGATGSANQSAGGGGGGGAAIKIISKATIGASQSITIGTAGSGASSGSGSAGGTGGTTSLGAIISATGGTGGAGSLATGTRGDGGVGSGGDGNFVGQVGVQPYNGTQTNWSSGIGGSSACGYGGGGKGGYSTAAGGAATGYGGGGGGAGSGGAGSGGAGSSGIIIITEYCSA